MNLFAATLPTNQSPIKTKTIFSDQNVVESCKVETSSENFATTLDLTMDKTPKTPQKTKRRVQKTRIKNCILRQIKLGINCTGLEPKHRSIRRYTNGNTLKRTWILGLFNGMMFKPRSIEIFQRTLSDV